MDYQCIVIYTIVRITPIYPEHFHTNSKKIGCLHWVKSQTKRLVALMDFVSLNFIIIIILLLHFQHLSQVLLAFIE